MASWQIPGYRLPQQPFPSQRTNQPGPSNTYPGSILQSAQDYDEIMNRYRNMANPNQNLNALASQYRNLAGKEYTPTPLQYQRGPEMGAAVGNLSELSRTGGYSQEDIANLRARGISPIRAVYANAMRDVTRQKALQGGYSPNYTASMTKMARDLSEQVAGQTTNVNAGIAQNVAGNRLSIAPQYAGIAERETGAISDINMRNEANRLQAEEMNRQSTMGSLNALQSLYGTQENKQLGATEGMRSLYGTTPALPALYGQQAQQAQELAQRERELKQRGGSTLINAYMQGGRRTTSGMGGAGGFSIPGRRY